MIKFEKSSHKNIVVNQSLAELPIGTTFTGEVCGFRGIFMKIKLGALILHEDGEFQRVGQCWHLVSNSTILDYKEVNLIMRIEENVDND